MYVENGTMVFKTLNFCCGVGGQDLGFEQVTGEHKGVRGKFETIAGIDVDPVACQNFEKITGSRAICVDLFDRRLYTMFHGHEPAAGWEELTPEKLREHCMGEVPDMVFMSPPCKGHSMLLPQNKADMPKYQALNELPDRIITLVMGTWHNDLPAVILMENVPGITSAKRGRKMLNNLQRLLKGVGYVLHEESYDCGVWGGLGQRRLRYMLIARLPSKIPSFIFQPPKQRLKSIGEVLESLPAPGDTVRGGRMHRLPNLAWKTWERLALIPEGKDWRALEDFGRSQWAGAWRIIPWSEPSNTVTAATKGVGQSTGASAVADPRLEFVQGFGNKYRVVQADQPSCTVTGSRVGSGAVIVADPKIPEYANLCRVASWDEPSPTITGGAGPTNGALSVSDPRLPAREARFPGLYKVVPWDASSPTVTGQSDIQTGAISVADPRPAKAWSGAGTMGVMEWHKPAKTVTASGDIHAGTSAVADPRIPDPGEKGIFVIIASDGTWHRPITTFEMAMLQGFATHDRFGQPFELVGCSDGKAREYIGNAVPVQAATAIGNAILATLLVNYCGDWHWGFSDDQIWVKPEGNVEDTNIGMLQ